eukprot:COSAG05_NODE_4277_length_1586_cov_1.306658_2_plen_87_part_00
MRPAVVAIRVLLLQQGATLLLSATLSPKAVVAERTDDQDSGSGVILSRTSIMFQGDGSTSNVTCKRAGGTTQIVTVPRLCVGVQSS